MMKRNKQLFLVLLMTGFSLILVGCMPGDGRAHINNPAGFFWGIWHGWIAPISLLVSIFNRNIRIYETFNSGFWYDFGFYMAIISGFGGLSLVRRRRNREID